MPATTQQLGEPDRFRAFRRPVVMPGHPEYLLAGTPEQGVVNSEGQRGSGRDQSGHDQIGQSQSHRIARPAGVREQSVRATVMPHLIQAGTGEHSTHRSTASLRFPRFSGVFEDWFDLENQEGRLCCQH